MEQKGHNLITTVDLTSLFNEAFAAFLEHERENLLTGVAEQSLCGRLAIELEHLREKRALEGYFVDSEYNRNEGRIKTIVDEKMQVVTIRTDIILHSRGTIPAQDNLVAIEMKRSSHSRSEKEKDRTRLRALTKASYNDVWSADGETLPEHVCGYVLGCYLELNASEKYFVVEFYAAGRLSETRHSYF